MISSGEKSDFLSKATFVVKIPKAIFCVVSVMNNAEQLYFNELNNKFWNAIDKMRAYMNAANYRHVLIFLKSVSGIFEVRQQEFITLFRDVGTSDNIYAMSSVLT